MSIHKAIDHLMQAEQNLARAKPGRHDPRYGEWCEADNKLDVAITVLRSLDPQGFDAALRRRRERGRKASEAAKARWGGKKASKPSRRPVEPPAQAPKPKRTVGEANALCLLVTELWNEIAGAKGFAKVKKITGGRMRAIRATEKEFGSDQEAWRGAITRYAADADRWPERRQYGIDTFLRPSNRAKWFEAGDAPNMSDPATMTEDEAEEFYTKGLMG